MNEKVQKELLAKHPKAEPIHPEGLLSGEIPPDVHPIACAKINAEAIERFALKSQGGAGVSHQEDVLWHKMVTGFKETSMNLCQAVSRVAIRICTQYVDTRALEALLANR